MPNILQRIDKNISAVFKIMNICLFTADEINNPLPLCDERARHIVKILHKKTGDTFSADVIGGMAGKALKKPKVPEQQRVNYRITDDALGTGGAKTKYARNVEAIRTLRRIEEKDRLATSEEQEVLAQYVGWGGLPQAFFIWIPPVFFCQRRNYFFCCNSDGL